MPVWLQTLLPAAFLLLGAAATYLTEGRRDAMRDRRAEATRVQARLERKRDRREAFELSQLPELRKASAQLASRAQEFSWAMSQTDQTLHSRVYQKDHHEGERYGETRRAMESATSVILDDATRESSYAMLDATKQWLDPGPENGDSLRLMLAAFDCRRKLDRLIGDRIRELYKGEEMR